MTSYAEKYSCCFFEAFYAKELVAVTVDLTFFQKLKY